MSDERIVDVSMILSKWHDLLKSRWPNFPCQTFTMFMHNNSQELVRCRECKHWSGRKDKPGEVTAIGYCDHPNHHIMPLNANWFCADGAKMDGGAE